MNTREKMINAVEAHLETLDADAGAILIVFQETGLDVIRQNLSTMELVFALEKVKLRELAGV